MVETASVAARSIVEKDHGVEATYESFSRELFGWLRERAPLSQLIDLLAHMAATNVNRSESVTLENSCQPGFEGGQG